MGLKAAVLLSLLAIQTIPAYSNEKMVFSGGAPLNTHQPAIIVPILTEAFKQNGLEFEAIFVPSKRSLVLSNSGITDGELHRIYAFHKVSKNKHPNLIRIESELMRVHQAIFSTKDIDIAGILDLTGVSIAYQAGRKNVENILNEHYPAKRIYAVKTDHQAFNMLVRNRIDVVISESFLGRSLISSNPKFESIREIHRNSGTGIYAYIHKKHRALGQKIGNTLEEMKRDGTFEKIYNIATAKTKLLKPE